MLVYILLQTTEESVEICDENSVVMDLFVSLFVAAANGRSPDTKL